MESSIFDEDSTDDDDHNDTSKVPTQNQNNTIDDGTDSEEDAAEGSKEDDTPKRTIEVDEDDDDDENDDENKNDEDNAEGKSKDDEKKANSDQDEDDVEFDEKGAAIVGSAAPKKPRQKIARKLKNMTVIQSTRPKSNVTLHITKLPNLVGIQPDAFEHDSYSPATEEKEYNGYEHNMIRWKYKRNENGEYVRNPATGKVERESNARLIKWEDGSMSLHVGAETFVCDQIPPPGDKKIAGVYPGSKNGYLYLSQKATFRTEVDDVEEEEDGGTVLECMGPIISRITPRPSSLQSESHKALTMAVRQRVMKRAKIVEYVTQEDPEKAKQDRIRQNTDLNKANTARRKTEYNYRTKRGMNQRYLEDDNYDSTNLGQIKYDDYGSSSADEDNFKGDFKSTREKLRKRKQQQKQQERERYADEEDSESDDAEFGAQDSDDEEQVTHKNKSSSRKRAAILDEEESD